MNERANTRITEPGSDLQLRIEEVAARLFITHGYNGVSYLDIARELGISHSNIHYYYRTKAVLAEAVLQRVAEGTREAMERIWVSPEAGLFQKFVSMRGWAYGQYLLFNPGGTGGRLWGLLARFTMDADSLTSSMRNLIRSTLAQVEGYISSGIQATVDRGELVAEAPVAGITLQISSLISVTGYVTRSSSSFDRLDELLRWTYVGIARAYGAPGTSPQAWPVLPRQAGSDDRGSSGGEQE